jgi:hypothetical protein
MALLTRLVYLEWTQHSLGENPTDPFTILDANAKLLDESCERGEKAFNRKRRKEKAAKGAKKCEINGLLSVFCGLSWRSLRLKALLPQQS